jgi:hypothetical protein
MLLAGLLLACLHGLFVSGAGRPRTVRAAKPAVLTVCPEGPPACGYASIQQAVDAAGESALIKIAAGTYTDLHTRPAPPGYLGPEVITQVVYLSKTLTLRGGYSAANGFADPPDPAANPTTLDAQGRGRVLFAGGTSHPVLEGLRITGGDPTGLGGDLFAPQAGGGAYILTATAVLSGNLIYDNSGGPGGSAAGVMLWRSNSILLGNSFTGNRADQDGGGLYAWLSRVTLERNTFTGNSAGVFGGGLHLWYGPFTVSSNSIVSNTALAGAGMQLGGADGSTIRDNQILSNTAFAGAVYLQYTGWISPASFVSNTLSHNQAEWGGAIYLMYGPAQFIGNRISENRASLGGGVDGFSSDALFEGNDIRANQAISDGGGLRLEYSAPILRGNSFAGNSALNGGGIALDHSPARLAGNIFRGNSAGAQGGGLYLLSSPVQISATVVLSNAAEEGGGACLVDSDADLVNDVVAGNTAEAGSGVYLAGSDPRLRHTTIARNGGDSGVWIGAGERPSCTVALTNTVLVGQEVGLLAGAGCTARLEGTLWGNGIDWAGAGTVLTGSVNVWGDPAFVAPGEGDYHLLPWSAAVDRGVDAGVRVDLDGQPRPLGAGLEIGADECARATLYLPLVLRR